MRYFLLMGGFWGFLLVFAASLYAGSRLAIALRDASVGCLVLSFLFRFLHAALMSGIRAHIHERGKLVADINGGIPDRTTKVS